VTEHWYRLPREVVESLILILADIKKYLGMVLGNWLWLILL